LGDSRKELENLVRELRTGELTREKTRAVKAFIEKIEEKAADEEKKQERTRSAKRSAAPLAPGDDVYVGKNRRRGVVVRRARDGKWVVSVNTVRMTVDASELSPAAAPAMEPTRAVTRRFLAPDGGPTARPAFELDVRGMRLEEAMRALEAQLDRAILSGVSEFSVIHGLGEGVLQKGVRDYLRASDVVSDYYFSPPESGGYGKTIVILGDRQSGKDTV
jgi:DNA mismatch repair protein MutS2